MTFVMRIRRRIGAVVVLSAAVTALCGTTVSGPAAAVPASDDVSVMFNCGSYPSNQTMSRSQALVRSQSWIDARVPYSQSACHSNEYGSYRTDCSGYVSMAWGLRMSYTTSDIYLVSHQIPRVDLRPGDALNDAGSHVALFVGWSDAAHTKPIVREQAGPNGAPTTQHVWTAAYASGYVPIRYNNVVDDAGGGGSSLSGDGRAEAVSVEANGDVNAWFNAAGFAAMPWGGDSVRIGSGFSAATTRFADLDGDGRKEIIGINTESGDVLAWRNVAGLAQEPWGGDSVVVASGVTDPAAVDFADLDGDRRADFTAVEANGDIRAWHNVAGFAKEPWGGDSVIIAKGFVPGQVKFADLDGDGRCDIMAVQDDGRIVGWRNVAGFAQEPWGGDSVVIASGGFSSPKTKFADLDGDGRSEIMAVEDDGRVRAWHNVAGFAVSPWGGDEVDVATGITDPAAIFFV